MELPLKTFPLSLKGGDGSKPNLGANIFEPQIFLVQNNFPSKKILGPKTSFVQKNFVSKNIWVQKIFLVQKNFVLTWPSQLDLTCPKFDALI